MEVSSAHKAEMNPHLRVTGEEGLSMNLFHVPFPCGLGLVPCGSLLQFYLVMNQCIGKVFGANFLRVTCTC